MAAKIFIDGEAGTTGLQIRERLQERSDVSLVSLADEVCKDPDARLAAFREADVAILCLPDKAVLEIMPMLEGMETRVIDASTAHRVDPDWAFGFPELGPDFRSAISSSARVSNPGCYSTGAIAMLRPLVGKGIVAADAALAINAVSGYSGGGKGMIGEFASGEASGSFFYGMDQSHKHVPEIVKYGRLAKRPIFVPSVGQFEQGMIVMLPLPFLDKGQAPRIHGALSEAYEGSTFVSVAEPGVPVGRMDPRRLNGTNRLELGVHSAPDGDCIVVTALLDNLGKGASGAAVQNLNIMLGLDEATGL